MPPGVEEEVAEVDRKGDADEEARGEGLHEGVGLGRHEEMGRLALPRGEEGAEEEGGYGGEYEEAVEVIEALEGCSAAVDPTLVGAGASPLEAEHGAEVQEDGRVEEEDAEPGPRARQARAEHAEGVAKGRVNVGAVEFGEEDEGEGK